MSTNKDPTVKDDKPESYIPTKGPSPPPTRPRSKSVRFHSPLMIPSPPPGPSAPEPEKSEAATPKSILKPSKPLSPSSSPVLPTLEMIRWITGPESAICENPLMCSLGEAPEIQSFNGPKFQSVWQAGNTIHYKITVADVFAVPPGGCDLPREAWDELQAKANEAMTRESNSSIAWETVLERSYELD